MSAGIGGLGETNGPDQVSGPSAKDDPHAMGIAAGTDKTRHAADVLGAALGHNLAPDVNAICSEDNIESAIKGIVNGFSAQKKQNIEDILKNSPGQDELGHFIYDNIQQKVLHKNAAALKEEVQHRLNGGADFTTVLETTLKGIIDASIKGVKQESELQSKSKTPIILKDDPISTWIEHYGKGPIKNTKHVKEAAKAFARELDVNDLTLDQLVQFSEGAGRMIKEMGGVKDVSSVEKICTALADKIEKMADSIDPKASLKSLKSSIGFIERSMGPVKHTAMLAKLNQAIAPLEARQAKAKAADSAATAAAEVAIEMTAVNKQCDDIFEQFNLDVKPYYEGDTKTSTYAATFRKAVDEVQRRPIIASILDGKVPNITDTHVLFQSVKKIILDDKSPTSGINLSATQRNAYTNLGKAMIGRMGEDVGRMLQEEGTEEIPEREGLSAREYLKVLQDMDAISKDRYKDTDETMFTVAVAPSFTNADDYCVSEAKKGNMVRPSDYFETDEGKAELNALIEPYIDGIIKGFAAAAKAAREAASE